MMVDGGENGWTACSQSSSVVRPRRSHVGDGSLARHSGELGMSLPGVKDVVDLERRRGASDEKAGVPIRSVIVKRTV
jgi:hypothetical protein